jgi:hypothetical protein
VCSCSDERSGFKDRTPLVGLSRIPRTETAGGWLLHTTAGGDTWASIAARFGESEDDVEWMNPIRIPGNERMAYARQALDLDPENRGDSGSRRPQ